MHEASLRDGSAGRNYNRPAQCWLVSTRALRKSTMFRRVCMFLCGIGVVSMAVRGMAEEQPIIRVGIVGCDTSHAIAFTDAINNPNATGALARCQVTIAFPGGSPDLPASRDRIEDFVKQLRERGVEIVKSIEEVADRS